MLRLPNNVFKKTSGIIKELERIFTLFQEEQPDTEYGEIFINGALVKYEKRGVKNAKST